MSSYFNELASDTNEYTQKAREVTSDYTTLLDEMAKTAPEG